MTNDRLVKNKFNFYSIKDMPTTDALKTYYTDKYYQEAGTRRDIKHSKDQLTYFKNKAIVAEHVINQNTKNLLDVGCGEGFFAAYFFEKKWSVTTLDYSEYGVKTQNPQLLPFHISGDMFSSLENIISEGKKFNLINLSNVLEHSTYPLELLESIKAIMSKDSYLRISVPNDFSKFQKFLLSKDYTSQTWVCLPDHLHYFTFKTLIDFLDYAGFESEVVMAEFPIELFISNSSSNYAKDKSLGKTAHNARVEVDNFLFTQGIDNYINYYKAAAKLEFGRQIVIFCKIK